MIHAPVPTGHAYPFHAAVVERPAANAARLVLIRHGEVDPAYRDVYYGQMDVPLSPIGIEASESLAKRLAPCGFDGIVSSDASRASYFAEALGREAKLSVEISSALRERSLGSWQGFTPEELRRDHPEAFAQFYADRGTRPTGDAETYEEMGIRVRRMLDPVARASAGKKIAVVVHAGPIRAQVMHALGITSARSFSFVLRYHSHTVIDYRDVATKGLGDPLVQCVNA